MLSQLLHRETIAASELLASKLYDEITSYSPFLKDLKNCHSEVIIESSFVTNWRLIELLPPLKKLKERSVRIADITNDAREHGRDYNLKMP